MFTFTNKSLLHRNRTLTRLTITSTYRSALVASIALAILLLLPGISSALSSPTSTPNIAGHLNLSTQPVHHKAVKPKISPEGSSGMDLTDAWNLTQGDPNMLVAYIEGGINWHLPDAQTLNPNIYVNWHELPVPCTGTTLANATMVISGKTEPCTLTYSNNEADYNVDGSGMINALQWQNDPRVKLVNGTNFINAEDLIAAFSNNVNHDGSPYPNDISGWDFYDNDNDPATTDSAYGHANYQMDVIQRECPKCMIMPVKAGEEALDATDRLAEAWLFAAQQGAKVIVSVTADLGYSSFMSQTINYLHSKGILMVESSNDFDSPDTQGGMFWQHVIPGNGAVANAAGTGWTRSDLTSWGDKAMFTVPTYGGSTSESTPTTGGAFALLMSYSDQAAQQGLIPKPLDGPEAIQVMRETATAITNPNLPWPGAPGEWNPQYGYGMPQVYNAMKAVSTNEIPPAPSITSPSWYSLVDPTTTQTVPVTGSIETENGEPFTWQVEYGLGGNPSTWTTFGTGSGVASYSGNLGTFNVSQVPQSFWSAPFSLSKTKEVETMDQYTVTFRVVVTDNAGLVGEDRRTISVFHDPTALAGFPMQIGSSGESQPALVDLQGSGHLDIVFGTSDGLIEAINPSSGQELPGWPVHTDPLTPLGSYPGVNPGYEPIIAPVAVGDLFHTGSLDVVATSIDGNVYVFNSQGKLLPGWPQALNTGVTPVPIPKPALPYTRLPVQGATAGPVLAPIAGTSQLQIVQAGMNGYIQVFNPNGTELPGWPVKVALPQNFQLAPNDILIDDQTLPTLPTIAYLQSPNVPDIVIKSQYTEVPGPGIVLGTKTIVFAYSPTGQLIPGWPSVINGLAEYYGSAMGPVTEGTDSPIAGPITSPATPEGSLDQVIVNPVFTPASLLGANGQVLSLYNPPNGSTSPFVSTGALGMFGGQLTFTQSGIDVTSLIASELNPDTGSAIEKEAVAFPANGGGKSYSPGFPTSMQGLDFLGGPAISDVTSSGQNAIIEGGDSSAVQAYLPGGGQAPGFPKFTGGWSLESPSVGDLFSNGTNDVVSVTREGYLFAWSTNGPSSGNDQWWRWRHDGWNTANYTVDSRPPGIARDVSWTAGSTTLTFTAPGSDWYSGIVSHYNISLAPSGQVLTVAPSGPAGTVEKVSIPSGTTGITIQAINSAGNLSQPVTIGTTPPQPPQFGYALANSYGVVAGFGSLGTLGTLGTLGSLGTLGTLGTPSSTGSAGSAGSVSGGPPTIASMAITPDNKGYWLVSTDGTVYASGDAKTYGSAPSSIGAPVVAIASTGDGNGYWLASANGSVYSFGNAKFFGSASTLNISSPIVSMAATPDGNGYWLASANGSVYSFGDASLYGGTSGQTPYGPIVSITSTPDGHGYWLLTANGNVLSYGDAIYFGSSAQSGSLPANSSAVSMISTPDGNGYWIISSSGGVYAYGDAQYLGGLTPSPEQSIIGGV